MEAHTLAVCTGATLARARTHVAAISAAMDEFHIDNPLRQAGFLANIGHESGGLLWSVEIWGPTPAQLRYETRRDLGNVKWGDGRRYLGRGWIQLTGRSNYREFGQDLGVDLEAWPERAAEPLLAARIAGLFWSKRGCNKIADEDDFAGVVRKINGGLNGFGHRLELFEAAKGVLCPA